jgi:hypothetical protein
MKVVSLLILVFLLFSCDVLKQNKNDENSIPPESTNEFHASFVDGEVKVGEGCWYILVKEGTTQKKYHPINLSEEYKKDGLGIHFLFHLSRAMLPQTCVAEAVEAVIVVDEIELK